MTDELEGKEPTKDEYIVRITIDSDKCNEVWSRPMYNGTKQIAREMIQESISTSIQKIVKRKPID